MLKKLVVLAVVLVLSALAAEGTARLFYRLIEHRPMDTAELDARKHQLVREARSLEVQRTGRRARGTELALHPYLGFVYDPAYDPEGTRQAHGLPVSPHGFLDDKLPVRPAAKDEVVVGFFGGSMALWVSSEGAAALAAELARIPELRGKRIVIVRLALGGGKQPQQLQALAYLLSLGAHFDLIVNLDGFNEVALPPGANVARRVFPFYPRDWATMVGELDDPMVTRLAGEITALVRFRGLWAEAFLEPGLRDTALTTLLWRAVDGAIGRLTAARRLDLAEYEGQLEPDQRRFSAQGPVRDYASDAEMYSDLARMWKDASLQMHRLSRANGIRYVHFLQPNQYFPGSKPLGEEERKVAIREGSEFGRSVARGYPLIRDAAPELVREGVELHDLTGIFAGLEEPLYVDDCCHVSARGNAMIGRKMGEAIAQGFAERRERRRRDEGTPEPAATPPDDDAGAPFAERTG